MKNEVMKIFTITSGDVKEGAGVDAFALKNASVTIPAIKIGEEGRGRIQGILPVELDTESKKIWNEKQSVGIHAAELSNTKAGKPKLISHIQETTKDKIICVFRTTFGFRGSNTHTGERHDYHTPNNSSFQQIYEEFGLKPESKYTESEVRAIIAKLHERGIDTTDIFTKQSVFDEFPGNILASGVIAQGDAGRMGGGDQYVAVMEKDKVFRTAYSGRLYGGPSAHYYVWNGSQLLSATREERDATDIF